MRFRMNFSPRIGRLPLLVLVTCVVLTGVAKPPVSARATESAGTAPDPTSTTLELSLDRARELAFGNSELVQQAAAAVSGAKADLMYARSDKLPQLDLAGIYTRNFKKPAFFLPPALAGGGQTKVEMGGDYDLQGGLSLTLNLWTAGRLSAAQGAASEVLAATRWQESLIADMVRYTIDEAYFNVLLADLEVMIAERSLADTEEAVRVTRAELEQGTVSNFDMLRAEVELANTQAPLITTRNTRALNMFTLQRFCGLDPAQAVVLTDSLAVVAGPGPEDPLLDLMRDQSAELKALRHVVAAQQQALRLAKAGRGPVLQLQGNYSLQGQWDNDLLPGGDETATSAGAALALSMPIFDGFKAKGEIGRSKADLRTAEVELERITRDRELAVRQARLYLINALAALEGRADGVSLATEAHRLALVRFENGMATPLERLDAQLALIEARVQFASTLHACNLAQSALRLAVGADPASIAMTEEESE